MSRSFQKTVVTETSSREDLPANMLKDAAFLRLWDVYGPLLTARQREMADLYFNYDLSLGEIAEQKGVSRQSVSDCLHKCRGQLEEYEEKLGLAKALDEVSLDYSALLTRVSRWIDAQREIHPEWGGELEKLRAGIVSDASEKGAPTGGDRE